MKIYNQNYDGSYSIDLMTIPNDERNRDLRIMQEEVADGEAEIIEFTISLEIAKDNKKSEIDKRTDALILAGINHNGVNFKINIEKEIAALALNSARMAGLNMAGKKFRGNNETYTFTNTADFDLWFGTAFGRLESVITGGSTLKDSVKACETVAELEAIIDART